MGTLSPALADALGLLRDDLHLDEAGSLANQADEWSADDMDVARGLIGDLVTRAEWTITFPGWTTRHPAPDWFQ